MLLLPNKIFQVKGRDIKNLLQNISTNEISDLSSDRCVYTCILNRSGRFLADLFFYQLDEDNFLIEVNQQFAETIVSIITKYKLNLKFILQQRSDLCCYFTKNYQQDSVTSLPDPRLQHLGFRTILQDKNQQSNNFNQYISLLMQKNIAEGFMLRKEKSIILDYNFHNLNCISFTKGCYIGQELISRAYNLGEIRKTPKYIKLPNHFNINNSNLNLSELLLLAQTTKELTQTNDFKVEDETASILINPQEEENNEFDYFKLELKSTNKEKNSNFIYINPQQNEALILFKL